MAKYLVNSYEINTQTDKPFTLAQLDNVVSVVVDKYSLAVFRDKDGKIIGAFDLRNVFIGRDPSSIEKDEKDEKGD